VDNHPPYNDKLTTQRDIALPHAMAMQPPRILLVDDSATDRELAGLVLARELPGVEILTAGDAMSFAERLARGGFDAAVTERRLAWSDGLQVAATIRRVYPGCPILLFSSAQDALLEGQRAGLDDVLPKDSSGYLRLPGALQRCLERRGDAGSAEVLLGSLPVGVLALDRDGNILRTNPEAVRLLGAGSSEALVGDSLGRRLEPAVRDTLSRALAGDGILRGEEVRLQRLDGGTGWARLGLSPLPGTRGQYQATLEDIGSYKHREQELARETSELGRANTELERFAYVASHDLQQPLGLITRYTRLFLERFGKGLDEEGQRYLEHVLDSGSRLQDLVDDLLAYARIGTQGRPFEPLDFGAAVDEAAANLEAEMSAGDVGLSRDELPTLNADRGQVVQLFQNLIGNAVKFRSTEPLRIRIGAERQEDDWLFAVQDNGIGIEPEHSERIFGMFQRLHTGEEYPGTGIGLAICKSIVERHGGRIWVESRPGAGSTFYFTIPAQA